MSAGKDILIIDDDRDLVDTLRIVLEGKDYEIRTAYDGKQGFSRIEEKRPDLIILDVMMATDTEGFDLAFKLQNNPEFQHIPILMLTSVEDRTGIEFKSTAGDETWLPVDGFLEKPVEPGVLLGEIKKLLDK